ncbi:response regulator transcription factor [Gayadomonas joobiniege]|uniref:response regulator transcription factor n=1 Tax=Gayadomonas joobiniege TaxID=1234606 RepID=UPI00037E12ED|nr:LuxR C-terminal-related transcriptional regulator [Gayadomonas joobiniege]
MENSEKMSQLSAREKEVLKCIIQGLTNSAIAKELYVTENTVKFHCKNIYLKLSVKNRVELICTARDPE